MARSALLNVMVGAAEKAGRSLARDFGEVENLQVSKKGPADFVSRADTRAEEIVLAELSRARPDYGFLGEEGTKVEPADGQHRFIVDPLDGTSNFLHGIPLFAVSIALTRNDDLVAGVVLNPVSGELFVAEKGRGAFLNDRRLRVAARTDLSASVIATGVPHLGIGDHVRFLSELQPLMGKVGGIRRGGSAALDLAWVAAGRYDGFWEHELNAWDIAAGVILVREAGGFCVNTDGSPDPLTNGSIIAGNEFIQRALLKNVKEAAQKLH
ncbi:MAG: inositol monophosphatase family protein [Pseudomonadota bacterium]